jgi:hypothetical protein
MAFAIIDGFSFGGFVYGDRLGRFREAPIFEGANPDSAGFSGSYPGLTRLKKRMIEIGGTIQAVSHEALQTAQDELLLAHSPGLPAKFVKYNTRYCWAQVDGEIGRDHHNWREWEWSCQFRCADPFWYDLVLSTVAIDSTVVGVFSTPRTVTVASAGTAFCTPVIEIVVADHTLADVLIENLTTGESMTFNPDANGTYKYHCGPNCTDTAETNISLRNKLTLAGADKTNLLGDSDLISLAVGNNSIRVSGLSSTLITFKWHNRYL